MKTAIIFTLLLPLACLAQSNAVDRIVDNHYPSDNLIDSDLSESLSPRIMNIQANALAQTDDKWLDTRNPPVVTTVILPTMTFVATILTKTNFPIIRLLFGIIIGIIGIIAACSTTPLCSISAGPSMSSMERITEYLTPENVSSLVEQINTAIQTFEAVRKLN
ncbi:uncharacterized protein LOC131671331 [Phymastichus coffea]|uniref:uncharacterized protein LOC131671331 n=1 Tax=Phymastichus coffea TaxID=108790 RepID=UPI00273C29AE|nr:uncharacterized protein LOC131671331 [Phymastichus coffea]